MIVEDKWMTLKEELEQQLARFKQRVSPGLVATIQADIDRLVASGMGERAIKEGDIAPAFTLPDAHGQTVALSSLLSSGPVVLTFYRGGWCPYCNLQLRAYQQIVPELRAFGAQLVAVSPQAPDDSLSTVEKNALDFLVLSDVAAEAARDYGLLFEFSEALREAYVAMQRDLTGLNADGQWHLPVPATYVIVPDGRVVLAHVDPEYRSRLEPTEIVAAVSGLATRQSA
jgi:peroxiredoxin